MSTAKRIIPLILIAAAFFYLGTKARAKPTPAPSIAKFNSVVTKKPPTFATAGQVPVADGTGGTAWNSVKGTALDSTPASSGMVLTANGNGGASWTSLIPPVPRGFSFLQAYYKAGNGTATNQFTVPEGITTILIEAWGGGGGGGGSGGTSTDPTSPAPFPIPGSNGGNGAPGLYYRTVVTVTPGSYTVVLGEGGKAGGGGTNGVATGGNGTGGGDGGATTIAVTGGATILTAGGGGGGGGGAGANMPGGPGAPGAAPASTAAGFQLSSNGAATVTFGGSLVLMPPNNFSFGGSGGFSLVTSTSGVAGGDGLVVISY